MKEYKNGTQMAINFIFNKNGLFFVMAKAMRNRNE
jgi:hypothetical protein